MFRFLIAIIISIFISSCSMASLMRPSKHQYETSNIPATFSSKPNSFSVNIREVVPTKWWKQFNDSKLDTIIEHVLRENHDIRVAIENYQSVEAMFTITESSRYPEVTANLGRNTDATFKSNSIDSDHHFNFRAGLSSEMDLWGKLKNRREGALAELMANKAEKEMVYTSIIAQTINLYFEIISVREELKNSQELIKLHNSNRLLFRSKYISGSSTKEVYDQSIRSYNNAKYREISLKADLKKLKHALSFIAGRDVNSFKIDPNNSIDLTTFRNFSLGVPSELLKNRWDIVAAYHKMESARFEAGAVKAELFPSIRLSASIFSSVSDIEDLFSLDHLAGSVSREVSQVLFAGGSRLANHDRALKLYASSIHSYRKAVLNGFKEVEDSLVDLDRVVTQRKYLEENLILAEEDRVIAENNYLAGLGDYEEILSTDIAFYSAKSEMVNSDRELLKARVELHKVLGGRWVE